MWDTMSPRSDILAQFAAAQTTFWLEMVDDDADALKAHWQRRLRLCEGARNDQWHPEVAETAKYEARLLRMFAQVSDSPQTRDQCDRIDWLCEHARDGEQLEMVKDGRGCRFEPETVETRYKLWRQG